MRGERCDVVLATMSPFELWRAAAAIADALAARVVFDLRDPWALDGVLQWRTRWHWWRTMREMRAMLRRADGVVANTPECAVLFRRAEPRLRRVAAITNGWDRADFSTPAPIVRPGQRLQLLHTGTFLCRELYPDGSWVRHCARVLRHSPERVVRSGRTPLHVLRAIRSLRQRGHAAGHELQFVTVGQVDPALERCVAESGVADACRLVPYRAYADVIATMRSADALFLTLHGLPAGCRSRIVPGKTYEYLASGRPILAALPAGDARDVVASSPRAFVADPTDESGIADQLSKLHRAWRAGAFDAAEPPADVDRFERRHLAGELAAFLEQVAGGAEERTTSRTVLVEAR